MFFLTDSELLYIYENSKSKRVHGTFGLGWKYYGCSVRQLQNSIQLFWILPGTLNHLATLTCLLTSFDDFTSIGKQISPLRASKSPEPSIPDPAALTTRNGRCSINFILAFCNSLQDLMIASTPFGKPARTSRNSLSYLLLTILYHCQEFLITSVKITSLLTVLPLVTNSVGLR